MANQTSKGQTQRKPFMTETEPTQVKEVSPAKEVIGEEEDNTPIEIGIRPSPIATKPISNEHLNNLIGNEKTVHYNTKGVSFECSLGFLFKETNVRKGVKGIYGDIDELLEQGFNYGVPALEQDVYHCIMITHSFDEYGTRLIQPYIQKFNKIEYIQLLNNRIGVEFAVIYKPKN